MDGDAPAATAAFLLATHFVDETIADLCREAAEQVPAGVDVFLLLHEGAAPSSGSARSSGHVRVGMSASGDAAPSAPPGVGVFSFSDEEVWSALRLRGSPFGGRGVFPGLPVLAPAYFRTRHPEYDRFWVCEYDVRFSGSWSVPIEHFASSEADLLTTTLCRRPAVPGWNKWDGLEPPRGTLAPEEMVRGFLPFYRVSRRGLDAVTAGYRQGWKGHFECSVPTILLAEGLELEDLGGSGEFVSDGNRERFYTNTPGNGGLSPGTFVFRPVRETPGDRPDTLWHPVKPKSVARWEKPPWRAWLERLWPGR